MSHAQATVPSARLTPSEVVLLHGDRFAGEAGMLRGKEELLTSDKKVSTDQLAEAALAAIVLANEQARGIRLEARTRKALFGLMSRQTLYASPAGPASWPEETLEGRLRARLRGGEVEVSDLLYELLEEDTRYPAADVLERIKRGLASRGLLDREEVKRLKIFTTYQYRLPESTAERVRAESPDPVRRLLDECERGRPEVWQLLRKHVGSALARRREVDDNLHSSD